MIAQQPVECLCPLLRKENARALQLDRRLCSRDRFGELMRPFHREIDVVRCPDDERRRPQRTQLRLDLARVLVIESHDEPLEVARALIGSHQYGVADLRPGPNAEDPELRNLLLGRAAKLERLGLADPVGPACWTLKPGLEQTLRQLGIRGDIIKTMHQAMSVAGREPDVSTFALHGEEPSDPVLGRLVKRGLDDELKGSTYAIVAGVDGRTHHLKFSDIEMTGNAPTGAIVEARAYDDTNGRRRLSLATRSDFSVEAQVTASGATWLDRQLLAKDSPLSGGGFGTEVRDAMEARVDHLVEEGLARRQGQRVIFARDLLATLRRRELADAAAKLSAEAGLAYQPAAEGESVSGVYRQRVTLASGRFAMIDDGLGFQLVPWRPALEKELGREVRGVMAPGGNVEWSLGRKRGLGL
jgi:hypothetical protein